MNPVDQVFNQLPEALKKTLGKDAYRIQLFIWAVQKKVAAYIVAGDIQKATSLLAVGMQFAGRFVTGPKISWSNMFDPWKPFREEARVFARQWALDALLVEALG